ncbi:UDP-glucosyltransferase 2-like [Episyrphus balteatus]|uniref:UDP-glucosyltransferase 2-like n=1 Tax=Episyrphus balteatus TaxID=286459 RepID=UPI002486CDC3|nr:UDP-glucosyltransferase 2-like [Episyrphus balteatus]
MIFQIRLVVVLFTLITSSVEAANILGLFLTHSPSHVIIHMSVIRALVERGHNVTLITATPLSETNPPYRHIFLKHQGVTSDRVNSIVNDQKDVPVYLRSIKLFSLIKKVSEAFPDFTTDPAFINFINEDNHFDLLILGYIFNDFQLGVAAHFKCPVVLSMIVQPFGHISRLIGSPTHPAFVPLSPFIDSKPMDFAGRIQNFILSILECKNFPEDKYPSYSDMKENISLILFNHHFSEGPVRPLVPGLVEMGGIQIKDKPDPLPEDIKEFLNNSPNGAIFFSLGSNVRSHHLGLNTSEIIFKVLSTLPYNVIWKYDQSEGPRNASNILFKKWLPQDDILSHKNIKLFITHAGKGSVTESEYHAVPMVALPVMGDQFMNAEIMASKGHGITLNYQTMTEESFRDAILNVIQNEQYKNTVQKFSTLYRDRPLTARENAVYWIEYVIRHRGAPHMQSPLKKMNILQENSFDVILCLVVIVYIVFKVIKLLGKLVIVMFAKLLWSIKEKKNKNKIE